MGLPLCGHLLSELKLQVSIYQKSNAVSLKAGPGLESDQHGLLALEKAEMGSLGSRPLMSSAPF